jgi:hypothetical protein
VTLPINWDQFTNLIVQYVNTTLFQNFMGSLDGSGQATATMNLGAIPGASGTVMHFAFALNAPWNFVSNAVSLEIVP